MSLRAPLGRVLGHGSAKEGVQHWWLQRLTSIALVPLGIGFVASLLTLPALDYATLVAWLHQGSTALGLVLFVLVAARHSQLGVRVVIEDYVHGGGLKALSLVIVEFAHVLLAAAAIFAILKIALGGRL
ncbi:MAG TPA: succinate dehydrogenase, hydrophobic membrane anchor protein [Steroidobacteraceae bacterium]|jgi:succinate dehydrogenase / fumarate reductase membrane anchor subunit